MINIAICDDESKERERLGKLVMAYIQAQPIYESQITYYAAPLELLSYVGDSGGYDLVLLDVYMDGMLGVEAAKALRQMGDDCEIIFITSSRDHSLEAFEVDAIQYVLKPYEELTFFRALEKALKRVDIERREIITIKTSKGIRRIAPRHVVFTESIRNNYQRIHLITKEVLEVRMTVTELFELLSLNKFFVRCGASLNINLKYVRQISKEAITFDTGERISYPYRQYKKMKEDFLQFHMSLSE